jgi:acetylglutamate kinase
MTNTPALPEISDDHVAQILTHAFDYKHQNEGRTVVVKASGKIIDDEAIRTSFAQQVTVMRRDLGLKVIVVHGAGNRIDKALAAAGKVSTKRNGLRVSEADHIEIIDAATREANALLCQTFNQFAGTHIAPLGLSGHDINLNMTSAAMDAHNNNYSGENVIDFNKWYLKHLLDDGKSIPIITNMCANINGGQVSKINVNADGVAAKLASGMEAYRLLMCSDVPGVLDQDKRIIPEIKQNEVDTLVKDGTIGGGMLVKVQEAFATASRMAPESAVIIMDEKFLLELLTPKGHGTMFRAPAYTA